MRIKSVFTILILYLSATNLHSQQLSNWSSFYENGFIWNPALTARWNTWELSTTVHKEWTDFENAPEYGTIGFQYPFIRRKTKLSIGGYIDYDKVGPYQRTSMAVTAAYKFKTLLFGNRDDVFSIGGKISFNNYSFSPQDFTPFDGFIGDPKLLNESTSAIAPNMSIGAYYVSVSDFYSFKSHYYFGLSANQILPTRLTISNQGDITQTVHATAHAGYRYSPQRSPYYIEPNIMISYGFKKAINVMANLRYERVDKYWISAGLVSNIEMFAQMGFIFNDQSMLGWLVKDGALRIGSKVDYNFGSIGQFSGMGYEVYVAYLFSKEPF
jgi:type IX secretion system PorP/SprF family membrane protein